LKVTIPAPTRPGSNLDEKVVSWPSPGRRLAKLQGFAATALTGSRALAGLLVGLAFGATAPAAAAQVTLDLAPQVAPYGATVRATGSVTPARRTHVELFEQVAGGAWQLAAEGESNDAGRYSLRVTARRPGLYLARADGDESPQAQLGIRPLLTARVTGLRVLGAPLRVVGRLRPAGAGTVTVTLRGRTRTLSLDGDGRFVVQLPTRRAGRLAARLALAPEDGYAAVGRRLAPRVGAPVLRLGAHDRAVRFLERRLRSLKHVLRGADRRFGSDTRDAVLAFEKLRGLRRDGVADPSVWRALRDARVPRPAVERGDHIEVDKARQVLFEVRRGRVVKVIHVSTGATGNTPVGRWRIYRKSPGLNSLSMYYSMYFLRGFATHGYPSVPPWPASHGCVRLPNWFAPGFYSRWELGDVVWVFPTTSRRSPLWVNPNTVRRAKDPGASGRVGP
jgi:peptidoglycan hydrolase-like protein with peptidoglycan-binding domain